MITFGTAICRHYQQWSLETKCWPLSLPWQQSSIGIDGFNCRAQNESPNFLMSPCSFIWCKIFNMESSFLWNEEWNWEKILRILNTQNPPNYVTLTLKEYPRSKKCHLHSFSLWSEGRGVIMLRVADMRKVKKRNHTDCQCQPWGSTVTRQSWKLWSRSQTLQKHTTEKKKKSQGPPRSFITGSFIPYPTDNF